MPSNGTEVAVSTPVDAAPGLATMRAHGTEIRQALAILTEAKGFADMLANSQFIPQAYRGKPGDIMACLLMGQMVGLNPIQALHGIAVINGKPSLYGDAALAVVRSHPDFADITERIEAGANEESYVAVCVVTRRGQTPVERRFSVADAKKASLWAKPGTWQQYPKRMLQMRARGFAIRDAFADALTGMILQEEAEDIAPLDITPSAAPEGRRMKIGGAAPTAAALPSGSTSSSPAPHPATNDDRAEAEQAAARLRTRRQAKTNVEPTPRQEAGEFPAAAEREPGSDDEAPTTPDATQATLAAAGIPAGESTPVVERVQGATCPGCGSDQHVVVAPKANSRGDVLCMADHGGGASERFFRAGNGAAAQD